jgi:hypothetical protein
MQKRKISHACGHYVASGFEYISLYGAQTGKKKEKKMKKKNTQPQMENIHPPLEVTPSSVSSSTPYRHKHSIERISHTDPWSIRE